MVATLSLIAVGSALLLSWVYSFTQPKIEADRRAKLRATLTEALPGAKEFIPVIPDTVWFGIRDNDTVGIVFRVWPKGYGGPIELTVGVDKDLKVTGLVPGAELKETPGLGLKIREDWFREQFIGRDGETALLRQDGGEIDAITAATISSRAVANGVSEGVKRYCRYIKEDPMIKVYKAESFIEVLKDTAFYAVTGSDTVIIITTEAEGFGGPVRVGMAFRGEDLINLVILKHNETEGYGSKITDPAFLKNIREGEFEAITGATISSKAVIEAVKKGREILAGIR